ncbi:MAG: hypothetical protein E7572_11885 [Ruminococcaceae bacterium]|jgi:hypothetical protein|nr:hypothetical protein [Oscillospiraceae bacterium]
MPINTLATATLFQQQLDQQMIQEATSGWMESNAGQVKYSGGKEIKIPKLNMNGLANYDRDNGYVQGAVTLEYETETMTQDRGRKFQLDSMDVDETSFIASAANVVTQFQRLQIIPEVDAYRYSKLAALAIGAGNTSSYTPATTDILSKLLADISAVQDVIGENEPLIISMSYAVATILSQADKITKILDTAQFTQGGIQTKVLSLDGMPIKRVPSARLKTAYVFNDGKTAGQTAGGFVPATSALDINWIISSARAPIAVSKTDNMKIFDPQTNQNADAWLIEYRKFHELWVPDNKLTAVRVSTKPAS